jgi:hypothetical protein
MRKGCGRCDLKLKFERTFEQKNNFRVLFNV